MRTTRPANPPPLTVTDTHEAQRHLRHAQLYLLCDRRCRPVPTAALHLLAALQRDFTGLMHDGSCCDVYRDLRFGDVA